VEFECGNRKRTLVGKGELLQLKSYRLVGGALICVCAPPQLEWVVGLLTGRCHLKGHLFKLGLGDSPTCEKCQEEDEAATHGLCGCKAFAYLRPRHLGQHFMEPSDYFNAPTYKILHFIQSAGLLRG
jgi:hypothetical protein